MSAINSEPIHSILKIGNRLVGLNRVPKRPNLDERCLL